MYGLTAETEAYHTKSLSLIKTMKTWEVTDTCVSL